MPTSTPRWRWTTDELPNDGDQTWIRPLATTNKPALGTYSAGAAQWTVTIGANDLLYPYYIVPQWRPQTP